MADWSREDKRRFETHAAAAAVAGRLATVTDRQRRLAGEALWLADLLVRRIRETEQGEWPYRACLSGECPEHGGRRDA